MEEIKISSNSPSSTTNKQRGNKFVVSGGVGGISGVLILGGIIAVTSLIRNRATKKQSTKTPPVEKIQDEIKTSNGEEDDGGQGLRSILQTEADKVKPSIMEEEPSAIEVDVEKQISTTTPTATATYQDEMIEPVKSEVRSLWTSDVIEIVKDGDVDYVPLASSDEISSLDGDKDLPVKEIKNREIISEENLSLPTEENIQYEDDDDDDDDEEEEEEDDTETETEREGSEGTGESSMDSNSEAIWPAESIELMAKDRVLIKETNKEPEIKEETVFQTLNSPVLAKVTGYEFIRAPSLLSSRLGVFIWVLLAVGLLYHFFAHHLPSFYHLNESKYP